MRSWIVLFAVLLAAAGCGGGGGGSSAPAVIGPVNTGGSTQPTSLSQNTPVQRSLVQQALTSTNEVPTIASYAGTTGGAAAPVLSTARRAFAHGRVAQSVTPCSNSEITTVTSGATSSQANITIDQYYDTSCTQLEWAGVFAATDSSTTITLTGSITYYTQAGTVYEYVNPATAVIYASGSTAYVSIGGTVAPSLTAAPALSLGVGCNIATGTASCSIAAAEHLTALNEDQAQTATATATVASTSTTTTLSLSGSGSSYSAPLNALSVVSQGTYLWGVSGASPTISISLSGTASYATTGVTAIALTATDSADAATVSIAYSPTTQLYTGTVTPSAGGASVASFSVSATGTGTVTYGNGTTASVVNWVVQS